MKISTKGRYGLRAVVDLALHTGEGFVSLTSIAERQDLSLNYLESQFASLKRAGLVTATAGLQGGYRLAYAPEDITLEMVLTALEGDLSVTSGDKGEETSLRLFLRGEVWDKIDRKVSKILKNTTIAHMVAEYENKTLAADCSSL